MLPSLGEADCLNLIVCADHGAHQGYWEPLGTGQADSDMSLPSPVVFERRGSMIFCRRRHRRRGHVRALKAFEARARVEQGMRYEVDP